MRILITGLLAFLVISGALASASAQPGKVDPEVETLVRGNSEFAANLYLRLAEKEVGNLFFSPYSISNALAMTYAGAKGNTALEMRATLRFPLEDDRLHPVFGKLIANLHDGEEKRTFQLSVANRLWGQKDYGFLPDFTKIGLDNYRAGLEEVDYIRDAEGAREKINAWVEKETKEKIKDLIPEGVLDDMTRLVLTNAIYFKAAWASPFREEQTKPGDFHIASGKTVKAPMMHQSQRANFADFGDFTILNLPYEGMEQSMLVFLPKRKDGLPDLEKRISAENLAKWSAKLSNHQVDVKLPKFKVTAEFKLNDYLKEMGMKDAFIFRKADFSGMATREKLYISAVLHKAFVDVNEAGTEAAASTAVVIGTRSLPPPATFHADRPFVFVIRDNRSGSMLFMGRVVDPS